jgi:hypothetical protein
VRSNKKEATKLSKTKENIMHYSIKANMHDRIKKCNRMKEI